MFTQPDPIAQLAAEHYQHMLAQARQRTLRHQHGRRSSTMPEAAVRITRRLAAAITRAEGVAAETPGATWSARPYRSAHQPPKPSHQGHGH